MSKSNRPDFSDFLAHFTTDRKPVSKEENNPAKCKESLSAKDRLISILNDTSMPWTGDHAICFTECPWSSLIDHTSNYSTYAIGFQKGFIFSRNGSPVFYVRADQYEKQEWHPHLRPFVTPFWPVYRPKSLNAKVTFRKDTCPIGGNIIFLTKGATFYRL